MRILNFIFAFGLVGFARCVEMWGLDPDQRIDRCILVPEVAMSVEEGVLDRARLKCVASPSTLAPRLTPEVFGKIESFVGRKIMPVQLSQEVFPGKNVYSLTIGLDEIFNKHHLDLLKPHICTDKNGSTVAVVEVPYLHEAVGQYGCDSCRRRSGRYAYQSFIQLHWASLCEFFFIEAPALSDTDQIRKSETGTVSLNDICDLIDKGYSFLESEGEINKGESIKALIFYDRYSVGLRNIFEIHFDDEPHTRYLFHSYFLMRFGYSDDSKIPPQLLALCPNDTDDTITSAELQISAEQAKELVRLSFDREPVHPILAELRAKNPLPQS